MPITNMSKDTRFATRLTRADTFVKRLRGLLGKRELGAEEALWIVPCKSVHTIGMRFPIDLIFVDKRHEVVGTIPGMRPYGVTRFYSKADSVLELQPGTIEKSGTGVGDRLEISVGEV